MKHTLTVVALLGLGALIGLMFSESDHGFAQAQTGPSAQGSGDALWHLPKFGEQGWFIHAHNGRVRACNMDKASVVGDRQAPRCSNWE